jgi:hypothetical protein
MAKEFPNDQGSGPFSSDALTDDFASIGGNIANAGKSVHRYMTGSRAIIKVNGDLMGFAHSASFRVNTSQTSINTIDDWTPYEIAPSRVTIEGTLGTFHIPGKGASKQLVQSNVLSFLFHRYITIEIRDRKTNELVFQTNKAVITSRHQELKAGELSTVTLNFVAMGWVDEMVPAFPDGYNGEDGGFLGSGGLVNSITSIFS